MSNAMDKVVEQEIDGETWVVVVLFDRWSKGPQYDQAPATVTRDGEVVANARWANTLGGHPPDVALVERGCLWAPGVVGRLPHTEHAFTVLTLAVQRAMVARSSEQEARVA
jgi:hypothetical protein